MAVPARRIRDLMADPAPRPRARDRAAAVVPPRARTVAAPSAAAAPHPVRRPAFTPATRPAPATRRAPARRPAPATRPSARPAPERRARRRQVPFALFALISVGVMLLLVTTAQALVAQSSFRLDELGERLERLEGVNGQLRLRVARLSSPRRLAEAARRAGLVLPDEVRVLPVRIRDASPPAGTSRRARAPR